jgi:hypothetical protein
MRFEKTSKGGVDDSTILAQYFPQRKRFKDGRDGYTNRTRFFIAQMTLCKFAKG